MSQSSPAATGIKAQYAAQVAADLEHNTNEQERISAEIAALDEQLRTLQHDHALLVHVQQAVGSENTENLKSAQVGEEESVPAQRRTRSAASGRKKAGSAEAEQDKAKGSQAKKAKKSASSPAPTLVTLVREHLAEHSEPRSAGEITAVLARSHPDRGIKATVVRTTAEGLVAKGLAQRTKQGSSVFYASAPTAPA